MAVGRPCKDTRNYDHCGHLREGEAKPSSSIAAFKSLTLPNIQERKDSPGNLRFEVYQQADDPSQFVMIEVLRSQGVLANTKGLRVALK
ncbi:MAG: antibiotic biosynthesis monooxygenase [Cyanobacteria bacterium J06636_16]